jgi:hypothetical protein
MTGSAQAATTTQGDARYFESRLIRAQI